MNVLYSQRTKEMGRTITTTISARHRSMQLSLGITVFNTGLFFFVRSIILYSRLLVLWSCSVVPSISQLIWEIFYLILGSNAILRIGHKSGHKISFQTAYCKGPE